MHEVDEVIGVPVARNGEPGSFQERGSAQLVEYLRRDLLVGERGAVGAPCLHSGKEVRQPPVERHGAGLLQRDIDQTPGIPAVREHLGDHVPVLLSGGHPQIEQRAPASEMHTPVLGVADRQSTVRIAVQREDAGVPVANEPPRLGVVRPAASTRSDRLSPN
ncbi:hypothetical protein ACH4MN_07590 [Streptomyces anulatus]